MKNVSISFLLTLSSFASCANILAIMPTPSYSHQAPLHELWKELSLRGHSVTLLTTNPIGDPNLINLCEINANDSYTVIKNISKVAENQANMWNTYIIVHEYAIKISELQLNNPKIIEIIRGNGNFDVVLVNQYHPEFLGLGKIYDCPTILMSSFYIQMYFYMIRGEQFNIAHDTDVVFPLQRPLNLWESLHSALYNLFNLYVKVYLEFPKRQKIINKYFNISVSIEELIKDVDVLFANTHPVIHGVRAVGPTTVDIGYERKPISSKPLAKDLKMFMDNAKDGFIYFSLGSNVKSKDLDANLFRTIMEAITEVPYTFLYKYELDNLENKPDNIKLIKWAPQYDILRHPNIKLFVTQGGFQSMEEAIYSTVPMVVIPFFIDQDYNARLMEKKGIAKFVSRKPLIKDELKNAIIEVFNNHSYKENIVKLRNLALDVPMTGLEKAIWWIEYVIRNKGAKHLRNPAADVPLYQYLLLDVIAFLVSVVITFIIILYFLIKLLVRRTISSIIIKEKKDQ